MTLKEKLRKKFTNYSIESPVVAAFLGDSVTHGCFEVLVKPTGSLECVYDQEAVYSNLFRKKFNAAFPGCPLGVINAGISGGSAAEGLARTDRDVIRFSPDLAVVCFGLNDVLRCSVENYVESLTGIFRKLKENDILPVFMTPNMFCTTPRATPVKELYGTSEECAEVQNSGKFDAFLKCAVEEALREDVTVCDCYSDWKAIAEHGTDVTYLLSNFINHPTRQMHDLFASRLFDTIVLGR